MKFIIILFLLFIGILAFVDQSWVEPIPGGNTESYDTRVCMGGGSGMQVDENCKRIETANNIENVKNLDSDAKTQDEYNLFSIYFIFVMLVGLGTFGIIYYILKKNRHIKILS